MSLIFKPKIAKTFRVEKPKLEQKVIKRPCKHWSTKELERMVNLRIAGVSYRHCAKLLDRGSSAIVSAIDYNDLYGKIAAGRKAKIDKIMGNV
tara:strand:- start:409 stop:687 length:279 start_codon:yes stop_codon:yes gene_type:complete